MQKTLIALGLAAALTSFQAQAADVTLYGLVDYGFSLQHRTPVQGESDTTFKMNSGMNSGSRFGLKGTEDLGNGMKVGFVLENGFSADSGTLGQDSRLFGREAQVTLYGDFGQVSFGRLGAMIGGNGTYALFGAVVSPFSCGWGDVGGHLQVTALGYEFIDNTINYRTPNFGGFDVTAQYSLGTDAKNYGEGVEGKTTVERMGAIAARYRAAGLMVVAGVETINWAQPAAGDTKLDDAMSLNLAGTYDFGVMKLYAYGQYFQDYQKAAKTTTFSVASGVDGFGINLGADVPAFGGTVKMGVGYGDFEGSRDSDLSMDTIQATLGFTYKLSPTTYMYTAGNFIKANYSDKYEAAHPDAAERICEYIVGMVHKF